MVFISYKSEEFGQASAVRRLLESNGIACWMAPDSILPGTEYGQAITDAIRNCDAQVLILTEAAQTSTPVLSEVDLAITFKKTIIPFHLDDSPLNDAFLFRLGIFQRIEAAGRLERGYQELVARVQQVVAEGGANRGQVGLAPEEKARRRRLLLVHAALLAVSSLGFLVASTIDVQADHPLTFVIMGIATMEMTNVARAIYRYLTPWEVGEDGWPQRRRIAPLPLIVLAVVSLASLAAFTYTNRTMSGLVANFFLLLFFLVLVADSLVASVLLGNRNPRMARRYGIQPDGSPASPKPARLAPLLAFVVTCAFLAIMYALGDTNFVLGISLVFLSYLLILVGYCFAPLLDKAVVLGLTLYDRAHAVSQAASTVEAAPVVEAAPEAQGEPAAQSDGTNG